MHIQVHTLSGKTAQINLQSNLTVEELSLQVEQAFGIPSEEQKLIFNGHRLVEGLLSEYGITQESSVYMLVSIEGGKGKKKKKKVKKPKKQHRKRKVNLAILKYFKVEGGKVIRLRQKSTAGTFMAEHEDRFYCGKSHITYKKKEESKGTKPAASKAPATAATTAAPETKEKGKKGKK
jgi:ubiquitin-small subunit ribosomal protein S27Ae